MKKNMNRKFRLNKETVSNLSDRAMRNLRGGDIWTVGCGETLDLICETGEISHCIGVCISINVPCESQHIPCAIVIDDVP